MCSGFFAYLPLLLLVAEVAERALCFCFCGLYIGAKVSISGGRRRCEIKFRGLSQIFSFSVSVGLSEMWAARRHELPEDKRKCPVIGCPSTHKDRDGYRKHLNAAHKSLGAEAWEGQFGVGTPFDFVRCTKCHVSVVSDKGLKIHLKRFCDGFYAPEGNDPPDQIGPAIDAANAVEDADAADVLVGMLNGGVQQGENEDQPEEGEQAAGDGEISERVRRAKQPPLGSLCKIALALFIAVAKRLIEAAVAAPAGEEAPFLQALDALPGLVSYKARTGKATTRTKRINALMLSLSKEKDVHLVVLAMAEDMLRGMMSQGKPVQIGLQRPWDKATERATMMVRAGNLGAAMNLMSDYSNGIRGNEQRRTTAEVVKILEDSNLFPAKDDEDDYVKTKEEMFEHLDDANVPKDLQLEVATVHEILTTLKRGSAGGQSGWQLSLLRQMAEADATFSEALTSLLNKILRGEVADSTTYTRARIALIDKEGGGHRPISVSAVFTRVLGKGVMKTMKVQICETLSPFQFALGVPGGVEAVIHAMCSKPLDDGEIMILSDIANAYGTVKRGPMAEAVAKLFPGLYNLFFFLYSKASELVLSSGDLVAMVETGTRQGCTLAGLFFCAVIHPILLKGYEETGIASLFFVDDGNMRGPRAAVLECHRLTARGLEAIGLRQNGEKGRILGDGDEGIVVVGEYVGGGEIFITRGQGAKCLGIPIGTEEFVEGQLTRAMKKLTKGLKGLKDLPGDVAILLIKVCVAARAMYLTRNCPHIHQNLLLQFFGDFDAEIDTSIARALGLAGLSAVSKVVRGLAVQESGIGIPRLADLRGPALVSSFMGALSLLRGRMPTVANGLRKEMSVSFVALVSHHIPKFVETRKNEGDLYSPLYGANREWVRIAGEAPKRGPLVEVPATRQQFLNDLQAVRQQTLTRPLFRKERKALITRCQQQGLFGFAAHLLSNCGERAMNSWIEGAACLSLHFRLKEDDYLTAMRLKLLVVLPAGLQGERHCVKCKGLAESIQVDTAEGQCHLLTCRESSKEVNHRHDMVRTAIFNFCRAAGIKAQEEVDIRNPGKMPYDCDVRITFGGLDRFIEASVGTAQAASHTHGTLYLGVSSFLRDRIGSAYNGEYTTGRLEDQKIGKAAKSLTPQQMEHFHPAVFCSSGKLGKGAKALFRLLKGELEKKHGVGSPLVQKALTTLYREIGTALWRGAARIIQASLEATREIIRQDESDEQGDDDGDDDDGGGGDGNSQLSLESNGGIAYRGGDGPWQGGGGNDAGDGEDSDSRSDQGQEGERGGRGLGYSQDELAVDAQRVAAIQLVLNSSIASSDLSGSTESEQHPAVVNCSLAAVPHPLLLLDGESNSGGDLPASQLLTLLLMSGSFEASTCSSEPLPSPGRQGIWTPVREGSECWVVDWGASIGGDVGVSEGGSGIRGDFVSASEAARQPGYQSGTLMLTVSSESTDMGRERGVKGRAGSQALHSRAGIGTGSADRSIRGGAASAARAGQGMGPQDSMLTVSSESTDTRRKRGDKGRAGFQALHSRAGIGTGSADRSIRGGAARAAGAGQGMGPQDSMLTVSSESTDTRRERGDKGRAGSQALHSRAGNGTVWQRFGGSSVSARVNFGIASKPVRRQGIQALRLKAAEQRGWSLVHIVSQGGMDVRSGAERETSSEAAHVARIRRSTGPVSPETAAKERGDGVPPGPHILHPRAASGTVERCGGDSGDSRSVGHALSPPARPARRLGTRMLCSEAAEQRSQRDVYTVLITNQSGMDARSHAEREALSAAAHVLRIRRASSSRLALGLAKPILISYLEPPPHCFTSREALGGVV